MQWKYLMLIAIGSCVAFSACRKKSLPGSPDPGPGITDTAKGRLTFKFSNTIGDKPIIISPRDGGVSSSDTFDMASGEKLTVHVYNYYISNIVLTDDKGNRFAEPESYHLPMATDPSSLEFTISDIPKGDYVMLDFLIGVDSVRNFSGAQSGALDPKYGMIWSWSTGYIMAKMEGYVQSKPTDPWRMVSYHIAGFKGSHKTMRAVKLPLPKPVAVGAQKQPAISLQSDLQTWFLAPGFRGFTAQPSIGSEGPAAAAIADNYSTMFTVSKIEQ